MGQETSLDWTFLWHNELLCKLVEGRMVGKRTRGRRRLNNSYEVFRGQQKRESTRKKVSKPAVRQIPVIMSVSYTAIL